MEAFEEILEEFVFQHSQILHIVIGVIAALLPELLIADKEKRIRWGKKLLPVVIGCVIGLNGIWQVFCMEAFNTDFAFFNTCILISSGVIAMWISTICGLGEVKEKIIRLVMLAICGAVISSVFAGLLDIFSIVTVMVVTGRGGA